MKQLMFIRVNGLSLWRKSHPPAMKHVLNQCRNYFTVVKSMQEPRIEMPKKPIIVAKKTENVQLLKRFSSDFRNGNVLMDFEVWPYPTLLHSMKNLYFFCYKIKRIDPSFSPEEFLSSATTALQVVTTLLSELRFTELEGLLTPECMEEVKKNIRLWSKTQLSSLAFRPGQLWRYAPSEVVIFSDEKNKERLFIEVRLIHYIIVKPLVSDSSEHQHPTSFFNFVQNEGSHDSLVYGVFNSKFIREYTEGVNDQWTINAINVKYFVME